MEQTCHVDAAGDDLIASLDLTGQTFTGESGSVQSGFSLHHGTVNRNFLAGLYHNNGADTHFVRVYLFQFSILFDIGIIRTDVHQITDVPAALAHGVGLEPFAHLVEQHHRDGLQIVAVFIYGQCQSPQRSHRHQKVLIEYLTVADTFSGFFQNVVANDQIIHQEHSQTYPAACRAKHFKCACAQDLQN